MNAEQYTDEFEPTHKQRRDQEDRDCIGGMRDPVRSVARLPGWRTVGARVRAVIDKYLDSNEAPLMQAFRSMGGDGACGPPEDWIRCLRISIAEALGLAFREEQGWQHWLAHAVGRLAEGPDTSFTDWIHGCVLLGALRNYSRWRLSPSPRQCARTGFGKGWGSGDQG